MGVVIQMAVCHPGGDVLANDASPLIRSGPLSSADRNDAKRWMYLRDPASPRIAPRATKLPKTGSLRASPYRPRGAGVYPLAAPVWEFIKGGLPSPLQGR